MDASSIMLRLSGKPIPIPVVVSATILAAVLAAAVVGLVGFRKRGYTLAIPASALSGALGIIGVFAAPSAPTKSGNGLLLVLAVIAISLLTRPATKNALT